VTKFDSLTAGLSASSSGLSDLSNATPPARVSKLSSSSLAARLPPIVESPLRMDLLGGLRAEPSLLEEKWDDGLDDESFDAERGAIIGSSPKRAQIFGSPSRGVLEGKENLLPA